MKILESAIKTISPGWALKRSVARKQQEHIEQFKFSAAYDGAYNSRMTPAYTRSMSLTGIRETLRWRQMNMRDKSRELERNNCIASGMLDRCTDNIIGTGFQIQPSTSNHDFNQQALDLWESGKDNLDIAGMRPFGDLQRILFRSLLRDGDVGVVLATSASKPRLQLIEGDYIDSQSRVMLDTPMQVHGIELNGNQRPINFHVMGWNSDNSRKETVVPARNFVFLTRSKRITEIRGEPVFAQPLAWDLFGNIDRTIEAVVTAARTAACFGAVVTTPMGGMAFPGLQQQLNNQGVQQKIATIEPGLIQYLTPGSEITQISPTQPSQNFPEFMSFLLRFAGVNMGMPLELVLMDFSKTNFSSARASLLQAYRTFRSYQDYFRSVFLSRTWKWWLSKQIQLGTLEVPPEINESYWQHEWIAPGWAWVDPVKETQAAMMEVDAGLNTLTNIARAHGFDFAKLCEQRQRELGQLKDAGITTSRSVATRDIAMSPTTVPADTEKQDADDDDQPGDLSDT